MSNPGARGGWDPAGPSIPNDMGHPGMQLDPQEALAAGVRMARKNKQEPHLGEDMRNFRRSYLQRATIGSKR